MNIKSAIVLVAITKPRTFGALILAQRWSSDGKSEMMEMRMKRRSVMLPLYLVMLLLAGRSAAACPSPSIEQKIKLPGRPFAAEPSADNCHLYASIATSDGEGAVTVLNNENGTFAAARTINVAHQGSRGLALSHTGTLLAVAAENSVVLLDVAKLNTADQASGLFVLPESSRGAIYTQFSKDDALLFVSEERNSSIAVINVAAAIHDGGARP